MNDGNDGNDGKSGKFEKSRNAFGTAHRSVERLLLCDFLEHFVVGNVEKNGKSGNSGKSGKFEKSRNAFGTAHRPGGRLLLFDFAALRLPFGVTMSFAAFGTARHFVTLASKSS